MLALHSLSTGMGDMYMHSSTMVPVDILVMWYRIKKKQLEDMGNDD